VANRVSVARSLIRSGVITLRAIGRAFGCPGLTFFLWGALPLNLLIVDTSIARPGSARRLARGRTASPGFRRHRYGSSPSRAVNADSAGVPKRAETRSYLLPSNR